MAARDIGDGAIAGVITGIIISILSLLLALIGLGALTRYADIRSVLGGLLPAVAGTAFEIPTIIRMVLLLALVGMIIGAIYGAIYENIPAAGAIPKGIAFMLVVWAIFGLLIPLIIGTGEGEPAEITAASIVSSLISSIIWGAVLGWVFDWISRRAAEPGRAPIGDHP